MDEDRYDLIIIGAGPGGYVAAIRAGQTGMKTAIIEKEYIGGMCLNWGCIPTKSLLESAKLYRKIKSADKFGIEGIGDITFNWQKAVKRTKPIVKKLTKGVEYLLKKNGVEIITGTAEIISPKTISVNNRSQSTKNIIIATGSKPAPLNIDNDKILQIEKMLDRNDIPQNLAILGSGAVAVELSQLFSMMDRTVTFLTEDKSLVPGLDFRLEEFIKAKFKKDKISIVNNFDIKEDGIYIKDILTEFDLIINASLRQSVLPHMTSELKLENGFIWTDQKLQSSIPGIYAVGDVNGKNFFAHSASAQGIAVVNHIQGIKEEIDLNKHPINIYTYPEIAQLGKTEKKLNTEGIDFESREFPMSSNGKALAEGETEGFLRILFEKKYGEVLGVQIIAANATDLISEASAAMQIEATVFDVAKTIHAHPTVSEVFMEAGLNAADEPIHS
jgi:dihydrolipoyl dehydrogenase